MSALWFTDPSVVVLIASVLGLMVGSFLNVVIHRLPIMMERDWAVQCADLRGDTPPVFEPLSLSRPRSRVAPNVAMPLRRLRISRSLAGFFCVAVAALAKHRSLFATP